MLGISSYDSNSISTLFSSIGRSSSAGSSLGSLTSSLSDYSMIRSGSYKKLMTSYFKKTDAQSFRDAFNKKQTNANAISKDSAETLKSVKSAAEKMKASASALLQTGTKSVFAKETNTNEKGQTTTAYNTDKIYSAVKSFVDDYNNMIIEADKSDSSGIQKSTANMINSTSKYAASLEKLGITINSENYRLSINEETFKKADMNQVKSMFQGAGSYAYNVKAQASMVEYKAENEASRANTYTNGGKYNSVYNSGAMWDSYF